MAAEAAKAAEGEMAAEAAETAQATIQGLGMKMGLVVVVVNILFQIKKNAL